MSSTKNILTHFLERLNVKHTLYYTDKLFNEHPNKYDLFGLSDMLTSYGIENAGFKVESKDDIYSVITPFIAHVGGDFVVVDKINKEQSHYIWNGKYIAISTDDFLKVWSGVVLLAEPNEQSAEVNYEQHKKQEITHKAKKYVLVISLTIAFLILCSVTRIYSDTGLLLMLLLNMVGAYIGYLLLQKHLHIGSGYGDKICSLFKQADCNSLLETDAASLFGIISWSEIGLSYFISNLVIILLFPHLIGWMAFINICALPYTLWSIWYQAVKVKQWCTLCMIVQVLLWLVFFVNLGFGFIYVPTFNLLQIGVLGCIYFIPLLFIQFIAPLFVNKRRIKHITQEINSIKAKEKIFTSLLNEQPRYQISFKYSHVLFGNPKASLLVTVLTNPHCNPCAIMHERIAKLLKENKHILVQYIFSSFSSELEVSARYLIAVSQQKSAEERDDIYTEWFKKGKTDKEKFFVKHPVNMEDNVAIEELNQHNIWIKESQLHATPTILVNGYKLPEIYQLEDLKYFTDLAFKV